MQAGKPINSVYFFTKYLLGFILTVILFTQTGLAQKSSDWKLVTEEGNIRVFTRKTTRSDFKEVRILAILEVEFGAFIDALNDVPAYGEWVYKCKNPRKLNFVNSNELYYYVQTDLPFPLSDRDLVVHSKQWMSEDGMSYHTHSTAVPDVLEEVKGIVRIQSYESFWDVTQDEYGRLLIDYRVVADPGGYLPVWMVNMAVTQGPLETMKNLETFVKNRSFLADKRRKK